MISPAKTPVYVPSYSAKMVTALAAATAAIARLDARICGTPVRQAWQQRAAWSGYAQALNLQQAEIAEIDVFSWACALKIPGRALRATHLDVFDQFGSWLAALYDPDPLAWRDALPTAIGEPEAAAQHPALIRALDSVRQQAWRDGSIQPWLAQPFALRDAKLTAAPLPCLAGGVKAFRLRKTPSDDDWYAALRSVGAAATSGLARLDALERVFRDAQRALLAEYRPGALPRLLALVLHRPLLSPQRVADLLDLSVAGASKLLERGAATGLIIEITQRRSWRLFLAADLAVEFGFAKPKLGRPSHEPSPLPQSRSLADVFDAFDQELTEIDKLLGSAGR